MMALEPHFLRGSYPPIVTPITEGRVDYDAYARLVEFQIDGGSHGIVVNGTTAEPSTLSVDERNRLVEIAVKTSAGRIPVVAATGSQSHAETVALTEFADRAGVDALLVVTPYYVRPPQRGLVEYYVDVARRTSLPMMIYHIPGRTAVSVELSSLEQIVERAPNMVGIKHAVNDLAFVTQMLDRFGFDFRVFVGLEDLSFPMLAVGACGVMNAVSNIAPAKVAALYEAGIAGDMAAARALHFELFELNSAVFFDTNPIPMKYMMRRLGLIPKNEHRLPMVPASATLESRLDQVLGRAGLL
jgi:4-hydroxy-tetrahydrodipicolinate synthase